MSAGTGRRPDSAEPRKCGLAGCGCRKAPGRDRFHSRKGRGHHQRYTEQTPAGLRESEVPGVEAGISATNQTCSGLLPASPSLASFSDGSRFQFHPEVSSFLGPAQQALPDPSLLHLLPLSLPARSSQAEVGAPTSPFAAL